VDCEDGEPEAEGLRSAGGDVLDVADGEGELLAVESVSSPAGDDCDDAGAQMSAKALGANGLRQIKAAAESLAARLFHHEHRAICVAPMVTGNPFRAQLPSGSVGAAESWARLPAAQQARRYPPAHRPGSRGLRIAVLLTCGVSS
jgi:hypothetical protein